MTDEELMQAVVRQENAKARLLIATAEAVVTILNDNTYHPGAVANHLQALIDELRDASRI